MQNTFHWKLPLNSKTRLHLKQGLPVSVPLKNSRLLSFMQILYKMVTFHREKYKWRQCQNEFQVRSTLLPVFYQCPKNVLFSFFWQKFPVSSKISKFIWTQRDISALRLHNNHLHLRMCLPAVNSRYSRVPNRQKNGDIFYSRNGVIFLTLCHCY